MRETKIKTNQIDYDFDGHGGGAESITLLSITTAPQAPFKAGDKFYSNEETEQFEANMVYKAVVDNSWEYAEALTPELGVFYIFDGETYLYDAKIESLFKIGDSTSSNELYILNESLPANTTTLETTVDFGENFLINVYINGLLQTRNLHYYVSGTDIIFTSGFDEAVNVTILYTSSSDVNINNTPTGTVNYNELINKPKINNVDLIGNKTSDNLGLQDKLVSGTNIKTINSNSILGSGDITISGSNVVELTEGTNINNLRQEGTFFIKNPTGTIPSSISTSGTYWCILTQEKCYDDNFGTYWYLQTGKFSYLSPGPGAGAIPAWETYTRQITDYTYIMGSAWQRLDNLSERIYGYSIPSSDADVSLSLTSYSNVESDSVVSIGYIVGAGWRTIKSLELSTGLNGSCKLFFKTYDGASGTHVPFSITLNGTISTQILNIDILTNYEFKYSTIYEIDFQKVSSDNKYTITIIEIDKPLMQEEFPSQSGQSGKFLTTDGSTMSWATIQSGDSLPDQTGQSGKFLTTDGSTASWAEVQGGSATITYFDSTNWTLDVTNTILSTGLSLGNNINVFKNGQLIEPGALNDYTISGNNIVFTEPLTSTDKVAVINGNMNPMQSVGYNTFSNKSVLSTDWQSSSEYSGYIYEYAIPCTGVTSTMYAQVTFAPEEAMSGNYANICDTGTGVVTIYSKVAEAITIPMIMVLGV